MSREPPAKHTPGPWSARLNQWSRWEIHYASGQLASVASPDDPASPPRTYPECEANARLIAAAPDMLEALKLAQKWLSNCAPVVTIEGPTPLPVIAAAIAKAQS